MAGIAPWPTHLAEAFTTYGIQDSCGGTYSAGKQRTDTDDKHDVEHSGADHCTKTNVILTHT